MRAPPIEARRGPRSRLAGFSVDEFAVDEAPRVLGTQWDDFRERVDGWTPYHEPWHLALWERTLGRSRGGACRIVAAWDGAGRLAAFAPLMRIRDRAGPLPISTLKFIGNNVGYPGDIMHGQVYAPAPELAAVQATLAHAASSWRLRKWDLGYLPPASPTRQAASGVLRDGLVDARFLRHTPFASLDLPGDWDRYLASLSHNTRHTYRRHRKRLEAKGGLEVVVEDRPEGARRRVEELLRNHERWLSGTERAGWFGDAAVKAFLVSSAELLAQHRSFLASVLELDGSPIAWDVGPIFRRTYFDYLTSYDREYGADSPGLVLALEFFRTLIGRGYRRIDLGPGFGQRKRGLGGTEEPYPRVLGYVGWMGRLARARRRFQRGPSG